MYNFQSSIGTYNRNLTFMLLFCCFYQRCEMFLVFIITQQITAQHNKDVINLKLLNRSHTNIQTDTCILFCVLNRFCSQHHNSFSTMSRTYNHRSSDNYTTIPLSHRNGNNTKQSYCHDTFQFQPALRT